jgi:hypothetical protein
VHFSFPKAFFWARHSTSGTAVLRTQKNMTGWVCGVCTLVSDSGACAEQKIIVKATFVRRVVESATNATKNSTLCEKEKNEKMHLGGKSGKKPTTGQWTN